MQEASFPHEFGAFLGYPAHDIDGFIAHRGEGYLLTGEWKVYRNEQAAKELFVRYHACRQSILQKMKEGKTLAQLFCTAQRV